MGCLLLRCELAPCRFVAGGASNLASHFQKNCFCISLGRFDFSLCCLHGVPSPFSSPVYTVLVPLFPSDIRRNGSFLRDEGRNSLGRLLPTATLRHPFAFSPKNSPSFSFFQSGSDDPLEAFFLLQRLPPSRSYFLFTLAYFLSTRTLPSKGSDAEPENHSFPLSSTLPFFSLAGCVANPSLLFPRCVLPLLLSCSPHCFGFVFFQVPNLRHLYSFDLKGPVPQKLKMRTFSLQVEDLHLPLEGTRPLIFFFPSPTRSSRRS